MAACSGSSDSSFAASSYLAPHRHFGHFARTFLAGVSQGPQLVSSTSHHMHVRGWGSLLSEASWTAREIRRLFFPASPYFVSGVHFLHFSSDGRGEFWHAWAGPVHCFLQHPKEAWQLFSSFDHIPQNFRFFDFNRSWQPAH